MTTVLDAFISAFQKLDSEATPLAAEIAALQAEQAAYEASVSAQAQASVTAALNSAGLSPAAITALGDRVTVLENAVAALDTAGNLAPPPPLTLTPTSITGPVGTPINGSFEITGGVAPYSVGSTGQPTDTTVSSTGAYSVAGNTPETASLSVVVTDSSTPPLTLTQTVSLSVTGVVNPPPPPPPATLTVSPSTLSETAGSAFTSPLSFSGGTPPYTASGLSGGVTFDGANLVGDTTTTAGSDTVEFTDSSSPALTTTLVLTLS